MSNVEIKRHWKIAYSTPKLLHLFPRAHEELEELHWADRTAFEKINQQYFFPVECMEVLAYVDGVLAGGCGVADGADMHFGKIGQVLALYVLPEYARTSLGIGMKLIKEAKIVTRDVFQRRCLSFTHRRKYNEYITRYSKCR